MVRQKKYPDQPTQPFSLKAIHLPKDRNLQSEERREGTLTFKENHELQDAPV